jgi:hypothetical protein
MKCHGIGKLLCDVFSDVDTFEVKPDLLHKHVSEQNLNHFPSYKIVLISTSSPDDWMMLKDTSLYYSVVPKLFSPRLGDLHKNNDEIQVFLNSCSIGIDLILVEVQMKETELHKNDTLKDAFTEGNYKSFMVAHPKVPSPSKLQQRKC